MRILIILCLMNVFLTATSQPLKIAYNVLMQDTVHRNNYDVFIMNLDGSKRTNITQHKDVAWIYNAAGDRVFFISDRDSCYRCYFLYETNAYGANPRKVTELQLEDSWIGQSENGNTLLVSARHENEFRFQPYIVNTSSGYYKPWLADTAARFSDFTFSPDGKQVAFIYKAKRRDATTHEELFIANADGTGMRQLTKYPENNISAKDFGYKAGAPRWHPTENMITYVSQQDGHNGIFAVTPDGKTQWRISKAGNEEGWHDWSPDGKWLVADRRNAATGAYEIVLLNWVTKEEKCFTDGYKYNQAPVFVTIR